MNLPADIARIRHPWQRERGDAWTTETFRAPVLVWLDNFLHGHPWARSIAVVERFHEPGIHRRTPYGPTQRAKDPRTLEAGFRQSDALPVLVFTATRVADREEFEVAIPFRQGALTDALSIDFYLERARISLEAAEELAPLA